MNSGTWSVVSTIRAPKHQVDRFIEHYLALGAENVYVFFDDPKVAEFSEIFHGGRFKPVVCDEAYWANVPRFKPYQNTKGRPDTIEIRQHVNMLFARSIMSSDWLLHVDADEYVYARKPVADVLAEYPKNVFSVVLRTLEAVYDHVPGLGDELATPYFRRFLQNDSVLSKFYPDDVRAVSWGGFWGVTIGKTFVRKEYEISRMSVHRPVPVDANLVENVDTDYLEMLHFEGQSFELFREKCRLRLEDNVAKLINKRFKQRLMLIKDYFDRDGEAGLLDIYKKFYVIEGEKLEMAKNLGFVVELNWQYYGCDEECADIFENPIGLVGQRISNWQGKIVRTSSSKYLAMEIASKNLVAVDPKDLTRADAKFLPVEIYRANNVAKLFVRLAKGMLFGELAQNGGVTFQPDQSAASQFSSRLLDSGEVTFELSGKYMCADPKQGVRVDRDVPSAWERFRVKNVYPQINWFA